MLTISALARQIKPSATLAAGALAKQLRAQGIEIFDFSLGEPDFATPTEISDAADAAVRKGQTRYTASNGMLELRQALSERYAKMYGMAYTSDQIVVTCGAKHAIALVLAVLCEPGDEVIIPSPFWTSYADMVQMVGAKVVLVPTQFENRFKLTPDALRAAITPKTRLLMINSPCNPTGVVYTRDELAALSQVILNSSLGVISDEIYESLTFDGRQATCFASLHPDLPERTITVSGASKSYAMTGWRMGWAAGPEHVIRAMGSVQSQQIGCPSSVSQYAALKGVTGDQQNVELMRREFEHRRDLVCDHFKNLPRTRWYKPEGAFYLFFDVSAYFGQSLHGIVSNDSVDFCKALLTKARVNMVPGSAFGAEGFVRMSFASSRQQIEAGLTALRHFLLNEMLPNGLS